MAGRWAVAEEVMARAATVRRKDTILKAGDSGIIAGKTHAKSSCREDARK
jgi:hypothetical protein